MTRRLVDLSHVVHHGLETYPGLPAPEICDFLSREVSRTKYAAGTEFQIGKITMVANTGTYVDAPFHRYANGKDLSELPLESLADLDAVVVRVPSGATAIDSIPAPDRELKGKAVLFHTGWSRHFGTATYRTGHPYLTAAIAQRLVEAGAAFVGIDSLNIDDISGGERPVHSILLAKEIPIGEHLTGLDGIPDRGGRFFAVPVKVRAFGTFPVRAFAIV
jgi:kynurenine formamidase